MPSKIEMDEASDEDGHGTTLKEEIPNDGTSSNAPDGVLSCDQDALDGIASNTPDGIASDTPDEGESVTKTLSDATHPDLGGTIEDTRRIFTGEFSMHFR